MRTKKFNITGTCYPQKHYMADVGDKIAQIIKMIDDGDYFTINRARQYGKTTTLSLLEDKLPELGYTVIRISFEGIGDTPFESEAKFCQNIVGQIQYYLQRYQKEEANDWIDKSITTYKLFGKFLDKVCAGKKYVLLIDETDKSRNNLVFLHFLGMLRDKYLTRNEKGIATFHNVVLAGVYDIKNLKIKMIQTGTHQLQDGEKRINSPWNIAAEFKVDMSLSVKEITSMLADYENDEHTGMNISEIAEEIRYYTNGYPFLASKLCKTIDEDLDKNWTLGGVQEAIKELLIEQNTLFDDLFKNVRNNENLRNLLYGLVFENNYYSYNPYNETIELGLIFGILSKNNNGVIVSNKIFELLLSNYFLSEQEIKNYADLSLDLRSELTENGKLNMPLLIQADNNIKMSMKKI
ncbi:MAG: AAA family ATPase [Candidatus Symbiothrix sp.]|jgi:hypothetical protein|nr:AAA family ATPase [Candidatus Symbiothrix sp.]